MAFGNTPFGESADGDDYTSKVQCSVEFQESGGRLAREIARDRVGREIYTLDFVDWSQETAQAQYWAGQRMRPETSGAAVIHYEFAGQGPDAGLLAHERFTDATNDPKPNKDGVFGFSYKYEHGRAVEVARLNKEGKPIDLNKKASLWRNSYDPKSGRLSGSSYYNSSGAKMLGAGGYWRIEFSYDRVGNESAETYYDINDRPLGQPEGSSGLSADAKSAKPDETGNISDKKPEALPVAKWTASYDEHGDQTEIRRYDWRRQLARNEAIERIDYDGDGRRIQHRYFDENDRPAPDNDGDIAWKIEYNARGDRGAFHYLDADLKPFESSTRRYATIQYQYDEFGNETDEAYFDRAGNPARNPDGIGRIHYAYVRGLETEASWYKGGDERAANSAHYSRRRTDYDSYGRVSEYHYYDVRDAPMQPPLSAATIRVLYDQNGNRISRVNLDQDGNPVDLDGWAEWIDEFDRENRLVRSLYFNADGRPALGPEKYASVAYRYDREGNQSRAEYLGPDLKRVPGPDGYALGTWRYDDGRLRERRLYAPDSSSVRVRLDPQGHEVETEYLDADGRSRIDPTLGCARVAKVYSPGGALLEVSYFNQENQLCVAEGLHYARVTWTQKDEKTWQATFQDASGASTTNGSGAIMFLWTQSADGASGEGRHIKEDGSSLVVTMSGDLATEYRYYDKDGRASEDNASHALRVTFAYDTAKRLIERVLYHADGTRQHERFDGDTLVEMTFTDESGNPNDKNDFGVPRVGFAYDDNKQLLERVRYGADGVQEHERFSGGEIAEIDFTDADGKPTDKNERQAYRVTFEYAADGKETGHTDYRSDGLLAHWKFKGTDDEEVDWHDAGGTLVDGPLGYARCRFVKQQTACTDRAGHGLVSVIEIQGVVPDSVAEHSKLQTGDLLVSYDGTPVADMDAFVKQVAQPGSSPRILVVARDGRRLAFTVPPGRLGINIGHRYVRPVQLGSP